MMWPAIVRLHQPSAFWRYSSLTPTPGTRVLKCREGLNNKAFVLTMDNDLEVFAKLPNPIAGPAYFTTASEVATREFVSITILQTWNLKADFGVVSYAMLCIFPFLELP